MIHHVYESLKERFPFYGMGPRHPENPYFTQDHIHTLQRHWVPILWPASLSPKLHPGLEDHSSLEPRSHWFHV